MTNPLRTLGACDMHVGECCLHGKIYAELQCRPKALARRGERSAPRRRTTLINFGSVRCCRPPNGQDLPENNCHALRPHSIRKNGPRPWFRPPTRRGCTCVWKAVRSCSRRPITTSAPATTGTSVFQVRPNVPCFFSAGEDIHSTLPVTKMGRPLSLQLANTTI